MHRRRREQVYQWLDHESVDAAYVTGDAEIRYLTGMPSDSVLVLFRTGRCVLLPWDVNLASERAEADEIIPYTEFDRKLTDALRAVLGDAAGPGRRVEIPADTPHPSLGDIRDAACGAEVVCRVDGLTGEISRMRSIKDDSELALLGRAAELTNKVIDELDEALGAGSLESELDIALFLERRARSLGGEGTGFEPIVAGPSRSNGIHAFPAFTGARFARTGSGIIDFGINFDGYTSDVTVTVLFGEPSAALRRMTDLVQQAYDESIERIEEGVDARDIARRVDTVFERAGYSMPHGLGHGIGLEVHEAPWLKSSGEAPALLSRGMVFTVEPGLYHSTDGGVRLENDVMLTADGPTIITTSRILRYA